MSSNLVRCTFLVVLLSACGGGRGPAGGDAGVDASPDGSTTGMCATAAECPAGGSCVAHHCFPAGFTGPYCPMLTCDAHATCSEGPPPGCTCAAGYTGDGTTCTVSTDPCASNPCGTHGTCAASAGVAMCTCEAGYTSTGGSACADADECTAGTDDCGANATCMNTPGSFACMCNTGYSGDGHTCTDTDECMATTGAPCSPDASCMNTTGSYMCTCHPGFTGDGMTCTDNDECTDGTATCGRNSTCANTPGSFTCTCNAGYFGDGTTCRVSVGQAIWIGADLYERSTDMDRIVGNSVAQATTLGDIAVLAYDEFADTSAGGEVELTDAAIAARMTEIGRTATITRIADSTMVAAMLPTADVFLVYEMENGGDATAIGTSLTAALSTFVAGGGVVIAMDYQSHGWQLLDASGQMRFLNGNADNTTGQTLTVVTAADPLAAGVSATYAGTNGSTAGWTNDGVIVSVDQVGLPALVHRYAQPTFTGGHGAAWEGRAAISDSVNSLMTYHPSQFASIFNLYDSTGQRYSPAADSWTNLVTSSGYGGNYWHNAAPVGLLLFSFPNGSSNIARYDTVADAWTAPNTHAGTAESSSAASDRAGRVYGYTSDGNVVVFDPSTGGVTYRATTIPTLRGGGSLYETRLAYDPGTDSLYLGAYGTPELYRFNLVTGTTTQLTSIPESQLNDIFCADRSGHIYAAGDSSGMTMWVYDIATNAWTAMPDYPIDHGNDGSCTVSDTGYLYVGSGDSNDLNRLPLDLNAR